MASPHGGSLPPWPATAISLTTQPPGAAARAQHWFPSLFSSVNEVSYAD